MLCECAIRTGTLVRFGKWIVTVCGWLPSLLRVSCATYCHSVLRSSSMSWATPWRALAELSAHVVPSMLPTSVLLVWSGSVSAAPTHRTGPTTWRGGGGSGARARGLGNTRGRAQLGPTTFSWAWSVTIPSRWEGSVPYVAKRSTSAWPQLTQGIVWRADLCDAALIRERQSVARRGGAHRPRKHYAAT